MLTRCPTSPPKLLADDRAGERTLRDVAAWQAAGFDVHSTWGSNQTKPAVPPIPDGELALPGNLEMRPAGAPVGLVGPVGFKGPVGARE